ncbi:gap junction beta-4 protein-like [Alosa sapidissima]|uniref:gap junction beta-4 protein-like n=1 Tax=Alosa sapidissima TaxID=34773 RepID=UPI001C08339F|nr:gap junction beta-4 protein-like [Alosa sapidissima]
MSIQTPRDPFTTLVLGVNKYSTYFGQAWLLVYVIRVILYFVSGQYLRVDMNNDFLCNTCQPGCTRVCYDHHFSVSLSLLWGLQLVFITCPALLVRCHAIQNSHKGAPLFNLTEKHHGGLRFMYLLSLVLMAGLEVAFLYIFQRIYGGYNMSKLSKCQVPPCPNTVDCFLSRPTEKKIFTLFMVVSACVCILMCLCEMIHLIYKRIHKKFNQHKQKRHQMSAQSHELGELLTPRTDPTAFKSLSKHPSKSPSPSKNPTRTLSKTLVQYPHSPTTSIASKAKQTYL